MGIDYRAKEVQVIINKAVKTSKVYLISDSISLLDKLNPLEVVEILKVLPIKQLADSSVNFILNLAR